MVLTCDRCKRDIFKCEQCAYCKRTICNRCMKSSQRIKKTTRLVICKDCWSNLARRKIFKSSSGRPVLRVTERERY